MGELLACRRRMQSPSLSVNRFGFRARKFGFWVRVGVRGSIQPLTLKELGYLSSGDWLGFQVQVRGLGFGGLP